MQVKCFGIIADIVKNDHISIEVEKDITVGYLRNIISELFPELDNIQSIMISVDRQYALDHQVISLNQEVALLPQVSGG